ncbi:hypothetical protein F0562_015847 [Nyssa sinensis]|uniref:VQ domain-containing protein n=1 Tax=Nyssa sinensis TaxID=561372 RepID=A0A5J4ZI27_9ASTE|nr:hypothetical protein F0562_015847 [Nyssa sinensis]
MFAVEGMMMKKQTCLPNTTSKALAMHKDSQVISKVKPKIRIIHIFAPEIIKTDVANFRELVQRLTGKPTESNKKKMKPRIPRKEEQIRAFTSSKPLIPQKMELRSGRYRFSEFRERIKGEDEMWGDVDDDDHHHNSSGGFLSGFADLDSFMQELGFDSISWM